MTTPTLAEKLVDVLPCQGASYGETCEVEKCLPCQACNARPRILAFIESELAERVAKARQERDNAVRGESELGMVYNAELESHQNTMRSLHAARAEIKRLNAIMAGTHIKAPTP